MAGLKERIVVVGAGENGHALLSVLVKGCDAEIVGVVDTNSDAPGLALAKEYGIPVGRDFRDFLAKKPDIVINATSDDAVAAEIKKLAAPDTEIIGASCCKLFGEALGKRLKAQERAMLHLEETRELYRIGVALTSAESLEEILDTLLVEATRTLKAPAGSVALYDDSTGCLSLKASLGFSSNFSHVSTWKRRKGGMTDHIIGKRVPTIISDVAQHSYVDNTLLLNEGIKSLAAVPLFANERITGILYIDDFKAREWTEREIEFITLLGIQAAYAIEKFRLISVISGAKNYLKNVLDHSADIIMTTNLDAEIVEFNSGATRQLGYSKEEVEGMKAAKLWAKPEERLEVMEILERDGYVANYETQLRTKHGAFIDVNLSLAILKDGEGRVLGTVGISKDITEKKRLEKAVEERNAELQELNEKLEDKVFERTKDLEKANRELERSNMLKSRFISTISHELRTPLNSILGFSELLLDEVSGSLTERQKRHVSNIYSSGTHLLQLINNVLDIAKIESGKIELHYESFLVGHAVAEVETVIRSLVEKRKQTLTVKADGVPFIIADKIKFKQILYNLISNAVKFTPEGGKITVEAEVVTAAALPAPTRNLALYQDKNDFLKLSVKDTGIGIRKEDLERVFSEFEQGDSSLSRKYEGTGLGLALSKRLVELHGGEIFVESEEGVGSTFTVIMPLVDTLDVEETIAIPAVAEDETDLSEEAEGPKARRGMPPLILIVEDDPATSEVFTLYLSQGGYRVAHVYNGDEAVRRIRELNPFAVLLDVMLPGKDGWEVLQEVKTDPDLADIPIIISSVIDNKELGFALGASDYLVKPVDKASLIKRLEELSSSFSKRKGQINILCIDENEEDLDWLKSALEPAQYAVLTAATGKDGIDKAVKHRPDLIILDLMTSDIDGFEVVHTLKANLATADVPILALTSRDLTHDERLLLAGKIASFIQKNNFSVDDLLCHIRDLEVTYPARAGLLDEVSGLFDHCYFHFRLEQEVSRTARYNGNFSVIALDLDNFTEYIKAHGIHRANIVIRKIAEFLRKSLRGSDVISRYGIDEFVVMLSNTSKKGAEIVAKRFLSYIAGYPFYGEEVMPRKKVSVSLAIVDYPLDATSPDVIIRKAHQLLRKAKAYGGGKIEYYE
ncbi:MAG: response regulator [Nitrospirae bacterium]|nr:response regulator [Nitrospirota bacterium]